jgi:hypothetical protein
MITAPPGREFMALAFRKTGSNFAVLTASSARPYHRRQRHTRCPLCHQHTRRRRRRTQTALSTRYSGSEPSPLGTINGADSAAPGIKASPAVAAAAPPNRKVNILRRSIVVIGFLPTNIDRDTIALLAAKSIGVQGACFDEARPHLEAEPTAAPGPRVEGQLATRPPRSCP